MPAWPATTAQRNRRSIPLQVRSNLAAGVPPVAPPAANPGASTYMAADLSGATQARLLVIRGNAATAGQMILGQYSLDQGATWSDLTGPVDIGALAPNVLTVSGWSNLPAPSQGDVWIRYGLYGGDGVATVTVFTVILEIR